MPDAMKLPLPRWVPRDRLLRDVPWLDPDQLQGAFAYHDTFNLHPERLLLAFVKSAVGAGAQVFTHMEAVGFLHRDHPISRTRSRSPASASPID